MDATAAKASHARMLNETVYVRRFAGTPGARTHTDYAARARVMAFQPHELVGLIVQGDRKVILLADDLTDAGMTLPVTTGDAFVDVYGKQLAILGVDGNTRRVQGTLIAYELQVRG